jgi:NADH:ubiquinone oxidoreductase subunit 4 (subunit M)
MSMALLGVYTFLSTGKLGCLLLLLSHGICSSGMFYYVGFIYNFSKRRSMFINKGGINLVKGYSLFMFLLFMPNMAVPLTINLFSEIYLLLRLIFFSLSRLLFAVVGIFLVAYFTIILFSGLVHGGLFNGSLSHFNITYDSLLIRVLHTFVLNISFLFIRLF